MEHEVRREHLREFLMFSYHQSPQLELTCEKKNTYHIYQARLIRFFMFSLDGFLSGAQRHCWSGFRWLLIARYHKGRGKHCNEAVRLRNTSGVFDVFFHLKGLNTKHKTHNPKHFCRFRGKSLTLRHKRKGRQLWHRRWLSILHNYKPLTWCLL